MITGHHANTAGVMIPIPQYPFYAETIAEFNAHPVRYSLFSANLSLLVFPD